MNVLYFTEPTFFPYLGGVHNVAFNLVTSLNKKITVTYFPRAQLTYRYVNSFVNIQGKYALGKFDIMHYNTVPNITNTSSLLFKVSKIKRTPTVLNIHGIIQIEHKINRYAKNSTYDLANTLKTCRDVDSIIVNSNHMKNLIETYYGVSKNKVSVIPNGIAVSRFSSCLSNCHLIGDPAILFVGGLGKIKGADVLFDAISKLHSELPNMKLHIIGGGSLEEKKQMQSILKREGIEDHIIYHGVVNQSIIPFYLKSADICVYPSRHEGFGIALLEAMASEKPVVASDIPSFREICTNGKDVMLFRSGDPHDLSRVILRVVEDPALKNKISHNALQTSLKYDWDIIADSYIEHYKKLCEPMCAASNIGRQRLSTTPLVSIGLPVYNGAEYIKQALDSILAQTYEDFELIICDNASIDSTPQICLKYLSKDKRIRYYRNNVNVGASRNHNIAFQLSSGELFKWASYDDVLAPDFLEKCVKILKSDDSLVLCHPKTGQINENGELTGDYEYATKTDSERKDYRFAEIISTRNHAWVQLLGLIRSDALRRTRLMGNYISADRNLLAELALIGPFKQVPEMLFYRRAHSQAYTDKSHINYKDKILWWTAHSEKALVLPNWKIFRQYYASVNHSYLTISDRLKCNVELMKWLFREGWILMGWDLAVALLENRRFHRISAPVGRRLSQILRIK